jgi:hypothetical protein
MKNLGLLLALLWLGACANYSTGTSCTLPVLQENAINSIMRREIKRRGGDPSILEKSKTEEKRDGCDYIYYLEYRPKRPGGYLFVRINEAGQILDWAPGL